MPSQCECLYTTAGLLHGDTDVQPCLSWGRDKRNLLELCVDLWVMSLIVNGTMHRNATYLRNVVVVERLGRLIAELFKDVLDVLRSDALELLESRN